MNQWLMPNVRKVTNMASLPVGNVSVCHLSMYVRPYVHGLAHYVQLSVIDIYCKD